MVPVVQPDPDWRKRAKQFEDYMTNIKKTNDYDKKTKKNKKQRGLTGEPDGPGGPLVPDSP